MRLLDLFCGAGGAGMGYHRAGFEVVGVDIKQQKHYPFEFHCADAFTFLEKHGQEFDVIHASPPCQAYSVANNIHSRTDHPEHVELVRSMLETLGRPYVIENVPGAPLRNPFTLCGLTFGLGVKRHRLFESTVFMLAPQCGKHDGDWVSVFGHTVLERSPAVGRTAKGGPIFRRKHLGTDVGRAAMGIEWMSRDELSEAIPPAYTEWIGQRLMEQLPHWS